jgi:hypothetical protein
MIKRLECTHLAMFIPAGTTGGVVSPAGQVQMLDRFGHVSAPPRSSRLATDTLVVFVTERRWLRPNRATGRIDRW